MPISATAPPWNGRATDGWNSSQENTGQDSSMNTTYEPHPPVRGAERHRQSALQAKLRPVSVNRVARFIVPDMSTQQCARQITARMNQLCGVSSVRTNLNTHQVVVYFHPLLTGLKEMMAVIEQVGCTVADVARSGTPKRSRETQLIVPAMDCAYYADHLTRALNGLPGVLVVATNLADHRVMVHFAPDKVDDGMIRAAVERAGYDIA